MKKREMRIMDGGLELRGEGALPMIRGYAAVFDSASEPMGWDGDFIEIVKPGAFAKSIQESDVRALWDHNPGQVLGRTRAGTLRLAEDDHGLAVEIDPPAWAAPYVESIRRGDVSQMSFGFRTVKDRFVTGSDDVTIRELIEVQLFDVSPVAFPAYPETSVEARTGWGVYHYRGLTQPPASGIDDVAHVDRSDGAESQTDDAPAAEVATPRLLLRFRELELIDRT